jgi:protein-S-isoprenylcysteine O-methyltransferase Ste14
MNEGNEMKDHPGVRVMPPLVFLIVLLASGVISFFVPMPILKPLWFRLFGLPFLGAGSALVLSAVQKMRQEGTHVSPHLPAMALVTGGPYRFSRNPIYLGLTLNYVGLGLLANTLWFLPFAIGFMLTLQTQVIRYEEVYLEDKFGKDYHVYKERVPRWF